MSTQKTTNTTESEIIEYFNNATNDKNLFTSFTNNDDYTEKYTIFKNHAVFVNDQLKKYKNLCIQIHLLHDRFQDFEKNNYNATQTKVVTPMITKFKKKNANKEQLQETVNTKETKTENIVNEKINMKRGRRLGTKKPTTKKIPKKQSLLENSLPLLPALPVSTITKKRKITRKVKKTPEQQQDEVQE